MSREQVSKAVLIAGPTASGKSALALELAQAAGGIVINADSMQVYRDLRIITARPNRDEEARVPHRLYGHVDAAVNFSAGAWVADAARALEEAQAHDSLPIFIGGTGLYFKALTAGLDLGFGPFAMVVFSTLMEPVLSPQVRTLLGANFYAAGFVFVTLGRSAL